MSNTENQSSKYDCLLLKNQLCFPLYAASREILRKYTPLLKELDLTYTQYIVMMVLWEEKELKVTELGSRLFLDTGTLSPLLKSMEKKNLLRRTRSKSDERIVMVAITEEGQALREKACTVPQQIGGCVNLNQEEAECLYKLLYKIINC